jgi:hypothetical protein
VYVNGKLRLVESIPGIGIGGKRRMMEGVNSTPINYKKFCNCHNVPPVQQ